MRSTETIKSIEKRAYHMAQRNGLFELSAGLVFIGLYFSQVLSAFNIKMPISLVIPILPVGLVYWVLKSFIIIPRAGMVRFGQARKLKLTRLMYITLIIIVLELVSLICLKFGSLTLELNKDLYTACILSVIVVFIPISFIAYFRDYWPSYLVAIISSLTWPGTVLVSNYLDSDHIVKYVFLIPGLLFTVWGIIGIIIFLQENPKTSNTNLI